MKSTISSATTSALLKESSGKALYTDRPLEK